MAIPVEALKTVKTCPLLEAFSDSEMALLAARLDEAVFPKDTQIFEQGADGDAMYLILSGQVGVVRKADQERADGPSRKVKRMLAAVGRGGMVGEMALVEEVPRSATVVALEDVVAARLTTARYADMQRDNPQLALQLSLGLFRVISSRIREVNRNLEVVNFRIFTT